MFSLIIDFIKEFNRELTHDVSQILKMYNISSDINAVCDKHINNINNKIEGNGSNVKQLHLERNNITDKQKEKMLRKICSTYSDCSSFKEFLNLEKLTVYKSNSNLVPNLSYHQNLRTIIVNDLCDLTPLQNLFNIEKLEASHVTNKSYHSDISPLKNLVNLRTLLLQYNKITDISPLQNLVNLEGLDLYGNRISDITPLKNLVNLQWLNLQFNNISDISVLKNLTNLKRLDLQCNNISDISVLKNLTNLQWLDLQCNNISDVTPLENLVNLESLNMQSSKSKNLCDITALSKLTKLVFLNVYDNHISDFSPLYNLKNLRELYIQKNCITKHGLRQLIEKIPNCKIYSDTGCCC